MCTQLGLPTRGLVDDLKARLTDLVEENTSSGAERRRSREEANERKTRPMNFSYEGCQLILRSSGSSGPKRLRRSGTFDMVQEDTRLKELCQGTRH